MVAFMRVRDIYETYQVPPWLQQHQVRVAAVGKMVSDSLSVPHDRHLVIATCLLHDIGAIVKFDFSDEAQSRLNDMCPPEEVSHWTKIRDAIRARYGDAEYDATNAILDELGLASIKAVFNQLSISKVHSMLVAAAAEVKIVQYGDMRVGPFGVVSLEERIADGNERYRDVYEREGRLRESESYLADARQLEQQLFEGIRLRPEDITDGSAAQIIESLWDYEVA
ncbi:MAG: HD domain-containing protein [Minisyncoccia bacterium]